MHSAAVVEQGLGQGQARPARAAPRASSASRSGQPQQTRASAITRRPRVADSGAQVGVQCRRRGTDVAAAAASTGGWQQAPLPSGPRRSGQRTKLLVLLSAACLAGALLGGGAAVGRRRVATVAAGSAPAAAHPSAPPGSVRLAVIAPLQQPSPFGVSWGEVLTHTAQLLAWKEPSLTLEVRDAAEAGGGHNRATLRSALASCRAAVVLGVEDPETAALLAPLLSAARTAVPLGCAVPLAGATRLAGRHVGDAADGPTLNPLAPLLQRLFPDKQTELDGQVGGRAGGWVGCALRWDGGEQQALRSGRARLGRCARAAYAPSHPASLLPSHPPTQPRSCAGAGGRRGFVPPQQPCNCLFI